MIIIVIIKVFFKFFISYVISGEVIMCICEGYCVIVYVYIGKFCYCLWFFFLFVMKYWLCNGGG